MCYSRHTSGDVCVTSVPSPTKVSAEYNTGNNLVVPYLAVERPFSLLDSGINCSTDCKLVVFPNTIQVPAIVNHFTARYTMRKDYKRVII